MDYEKEYKKLKAGISNAYLYTQTDSTKAVLESILPELKEIKGKRIKYEIIAFLEQAIHRGGGNPIPQEQEDKWIAWLEKQGNKSVNIDIESMVSSYEQRLKSHGGIENSPLVNMCLTAFRRGVENTLEELNLKNLEKQGEQKPAWSEENERIRQCLIRDQEKALDDVRNDKYGHSEIVSDLKEMYRERIDWLESIKDHCTPQWKPSEEQIDAIEVAIAYMTDESETPTAPKVLSELLEQLKNL